MLRDGQGSHASTPPAHCKQTRRSPASGRFGFTCITTCHCSSQSRHPRPWPRRCHQQMNQALEASDSMQPAPTAHLRWFSFSRTPEFFPSDSSTPSEVSISADMVAEWFCPHSSPVETETASDAKHPQHLPQHLPTGTPELAEPVKHKDSPDTLSLLRPQQSTDKVWMCTE